MGKRPPHRKPQVGTSETPVHTTDEGTCAPLRQTHRLTEERVMIPVVAVPDPADAEILFDLVNHELSKGGHSTERTQRLCVLLIALHADMTADLDTPNREN